MKVTKWANQTRVLSEETNIRIGATCVAEETQPSVKWFTTVTPLLAILERAGGPRELEDRGVTTNHKGENRISLNIVTMIFALRHL